MDGFLGSIPYRLALAGGWIDQPFVSRLHRNPPGSMVVVGLEPEYRFMDRCGMGTSTRRVATQLWNGRLPDGEPLDLVRQLYRAENKGKTEPSGSQDMAGLIYPGINRLDYDYAFEGGYFPCHVESCCDPAVATWLEKVIHLLPVAPRPPGYQPIDIKNLDPDWIEGLAQSGRDCYQAVLEQNINLLGASFNECMRCWETLLPHTVSHPTITVDLKGILEFYQAHYPGAMYSGCGGGYLFVLSEDPVPGTLKVRIRIR